jgi:hypothetical protein
MIKKYHLIDHTHNKKKNKIDKMYRTAAQIAIKYGCMGDGSLNYNQDRICEFWKYEDNYPCFGTFSSAIRLPAIKWYIHNEISVDHKIWNPDFLRGLIAHCNIRWNKNKFPSCSWYCNEEIARLLHSCPYGGDIFDKDKEKRGYRWNYVPALYLKHSEDSIQFMAGLMAGFKIVKVNGYKYASCGYRALNYLKKWGIPIDGKYFTKAYLISPIWPALFVRYMPDEESKKWLDIKKAFNANIYAPILWKTYIDNNFISDGIPYLKARRSVYYEFKCEEGAMHRLDMLRVEKALTELDNRVKHVVKEWSSIAKDKGTCMIEGDEL